MIVCKRLDDSVQYPPYLAHLLDRDDQHPRFSLDRAVKVAGDIELMGKQNLPLRPGSGPAAA